MQAEASLLERNGHQIEGMITSNDDLQDAGWIAKGRTAVSATWSQTHYRRAREQIRRFAPDIIHCHNTFPLPGPSIYYAARSESVPVVQTLHNYRLLCLNALLYRDGKVCRDCVGRFPLPGVIHACYRGSRAGSSAVALMLAVHRQLGTWKGAVNRFIALSNHSRDQFVAGGLPSSLIGVKSNFVHPDPGEGQHRGNYALFVGRLAQEKGVRVLLGAWEAIGDRIPLRIAGDGPLRGLVEETSRSRREVYYDGYRSAPDVIELMKEASLLIVPSLCDEHSPMTLLEGFATGLPAVVSDHGALSEIVGRGDAGWRIPSGDAPALASAVEWAWLNTESRIEKGKAARIEFLRRYSAEHNYDLLMGVYSTVLRGRDMAVREVIDDL